MAIARQYADRVNIIKMVKVNGKWPFARIVERKKRIVRDHVWVHGRTSITRKVATTSNGTKTGRRRKPVESYDRKNGRRA